MRVSRLEVFGFKSFMDRLVLPLGAGITGVVGPNGCGKSNVVDALRWVLGETKASSLRGETLEDVIFNGTETLRPLGVAEVSLVIRAEGASIGEDAKFNVASDAPDTAEDQVSLEPVNVDHSVTQSGRSDWLNSVSEVQITRRLYRSGESEYFINKTQCRLRDIKELVRALNLTARGYTVIAQGEVSRVVTARAEERRMLIEEIAQVAGFRDQIRTVKARLDESAESLEKIVLLEREVQRTVNNLKRQAEKAAEKTRLEGELREKELKFYTDSIRRAKIIVKQLAIEQEKLSVIVQNLKAQLSNNEIESSTGREKVESCEQSIITLRRKLDTVRNALAHRQRELQERQSKVRELASLIGARVDEAKRVEERRTGIEQRLAEAKTRLAEVESKYAQITEAMAHAEPQGKEELGDLSTKISKLRDQIKGSERAARESRDKLVAAVSRISALESQIVSLSPLTHLKAEIRGDLKLLVDFLKVPPYLSKALQSTLSERSGFVVSEDPHKFVRALAQSGAFNGPKPRPIGVLRSELSAEERHVEPSASIPRLLDKIEVNPAVRSTLEREIGDVFICDNIEQALSLFENGTAQRHQRLVTLEGDLISGDSFYSLRHDGGLVQLKIRISEANEERERFQAENQTHNTDRERISQELSSSESRRDELQRQVQQAEQRLRALSLERGQAEGKKGSELRLIQDLERDLGRLVTQANDALKMVSQLEAQREEAQNRLNQWSGSETAELEEESKELGVQLAKYEQERKELSQSVALQVKRLEETRKSLEQRTREYEQTAYKIKHSESEISSVLSLAARDYGDQIKSELESESGEDLLAQDARNLLDRDVRVIRDRLSRERDVNMGALDEFERESVRLDELKLQRNDLEQARGLLLESLSKLEGASVERFLATFSEVQGHFKELIPELFGGGGEGSLTLTDPSNPLESGVELTVRPPGKRPKSIDLLSGGEKAMAAVGLIFSMFMVRPSPLCVLDEVDAPLDDANVERFVSFVQKMTTRTQFIVITHNKRSMAAADTLVGVTQQQPGASKVISVTLDEAIEQAA